MGRYDGGMAYGIGTINGIITTSYYYALEVSFAPYRPIIDMHNTTQFAILTAMCPLIAILQSPFQTF